MLASIIIPYYKSEKFIKKTISSIINQTYKKWEIIIIDDENSNVSFKVLNAFKNKKIRVYSNKKNIGVAKSRNIGITKAKGNLICFIDSDDYWHKNKLLEQIYQMKKNNYDISYTSYIAFEDTNTVVYRVLAKNILNHSKLIKSNPICCSSVVIKKKILRDIKFPNIKTKEDYALWLKLSRKNKFYPIKKNLTFHRLRKNSLSSLHLNKLYNAFLIYYKFLNFNIIYSFYSVCRLYINAFIKKYF